MPIKTRKTWRKLHSGLDPDSGEIVTSLLTTNSTHDETALPDLCTTDHSVGKFLADGAYDGSASEAVIRDAFGEQVEIVIPSPKNAAHGRSAMRNDHIGQMAKHGRAA